MPRRGTISYGPGDLQRNTGETVADTGRVLAMMLDALVVRAPGHSDELAGGGAAACR